MKKTFRTLMGLMLLIGAATFGNAQTGDSGRLAGTFDVSVTPRICATGAAITNFQAAYYFAPGGTFSGLSSGTGSGGRGREQLGVWKHLGDGHYRFRIKTYLFDAAGVATSYQIVTHDGVLSNDGLSWSSTGDSRTFSLEGVEINAGCSTIVGSRVGDF